MSNLIRYQCKKCFQLFRGGREQQCPLCQSYHIAIIEFEVKE